MPVIRPLLGALILCSACAGPVLAGPHVDWLDDGTVLLKLGPDYGNAVIETTREELGRCWAPAGHPMPGQRCGC